jgi:membrane protease YdiL (CAAX protease family)
MSERSTIGEAYRRSWSLRVAALLVGAAIVAYDLYAPRADNEQRLVVGVAGLVVLLALANGDVRSVGLAAPRPSVRWWLKATLITGTIFIVVVMVVAAVLYFTGHAPSVKLVMPVDEFLWQAVVVAPVVEEPIYRLALCTALVVIVGRWPTIVLSGVVFAWLHQRYGNLAPDNALAGVLLGWAYLRSGSIAVPIVLHAIGNALVVLFLAAIAPRLL